MKASARPDNDSDDSSRFAYVYTPLDVSRKEIRTLTVHPAPEDEPVRASLQRISLLSPTDYETISYVWGDATQRASILVNGKVLDVHASAEKAIRRVRQASSDRVIWIDGVCINQADLDERQQQVAIMGDVYGGTKQNIVWLGESNDSTAAAIEVMDVLWQDILHATNNLKTFSDVTSTMEASHYSEKDKHCAYELQHLVSFFSNTWFERLWCVQEVALAPTNIMLCGRFELPLLRVLRVAVWCAHKLRFLTTLLEPAKDFGFSFYFKNQRLLANLVDTEFGTLGQSRAYGLKPVFTQLLDFSMAYQATKAADRVFALLGLIRGFDPSQDDKLDANPSALLMPNYKKPFVHVARDAAIASLVETESLSILFYVYQHETEDVDGIPFPTWVPRLHEAWDRDVDASTTLALAGVFDAFPKGPDTPNFKSLFTEDPNVLRLQGILLDPIVEVSPVFTPTCLGSSESLTEQIQRINSIMGVAEVEDPTSLVSAIARTLTATNTPENTEHILKAFLNWAETVRRVTTSFFRTVWTDDESKQADLIDATQVNDDVLNHCTNRRFFRTKRGFVGLGPREMRPTDIVVVVHWSSLPLVLRPNGEATAETVFGAQGFRTEHHLYRTLDMPDEYAFVGPSYVDGVMHGKIAAAFRRQGGKDMSFVVR